MTKNVLITGACKNTGYGIAEKFAENGYNVFITSRKEEESIEASKRLSAKYKQAEIFPLALDDSMEESAIAEVFEKIEKSGYPLSCIVLNAANLGLDQEFYTMSIEQLQAVFNTNVFWNFVLVREATKQMKKLGGGSVVFITSNTAYRVIPNRLAYESTKGALLSMSRAIALDLGKYGIRSNCVLPGMIKTDRWDANIGGQRDSLTAKTPIGDIADFDDIANATYYFGSDLSKNTTGAELVVDGGNMIRLTPEL
ncbi:MAG: SDR family oxidoreductase [Clostridia bacterium]|nr:SDR family oxidoreductase [Clostridia bacterium]